MTTDLAGALAARRGDPRPWARATVLSVDVPGARVTVDLDGAELTLPRLGGAYRPGDVVAVVRDPSASGSGQFVAGVLSPPAPLWTKVTVTSIDTSAKTITGTLPDGSSVTAPYLTDSYSVGNVVVLLRDPASGIGDLVVGVLPGTVTAPDEPSTPTTPTTSTTATYQALIRPTVTSTWRVTRGAWDRWNTRGDVYQAGSAASGTLYGLACYGEQLVNLGATSLVSVSLRLVSSGNPGAGAWSATVQGCASGSLPGSAPSFTGTTQAATVGSAAGSVTDVALPSGLVTALASGAVKSLGLVGGAYGGTIGSRRADAWALAVTYTKAA